MNTIHRTKGGFIGLIVVLVVAMLAIGGGVYVANKTKVAVDESNATSSANVEARVSLKGLIGMNKSMRCEVTHGTGNATTTGVVFVSNGNVRGDFTSQVSGMGSSIASHVITNGADVYVWSDMSGGRGFKTTASAQAQADANAPGIDQELGYRCDDWNADASRFALPADVTFTDMSAAAGAGASIKAEDACSSCDMLPVGQARTACQTAMGCGN